tara:strand:+ start:486 stop:611 length:126 start_codon:yes stop_codon:yes gene_type:complete
MVAGDFKEADQEAQIKEKSFPIPSNDAPNQRPFRSERCHQQ